MSHFKRYPDYKQVKTEWLSEIPKEWDVKPIYAIADLRNGFPFKSERFTHEGEDSDRLIRIRDLSGDSDAVFTAESAPETAIIRDGDLLIGMDGDFNVHLWQRGNAKLNQRMCALNGIESGITEYLQYSLPGPLQVINDLAYATTVKHLSSHEVKHTHIALPPPDDLRAINAALGLETARIDALIEKKTRFIELLKEKRQALITQAVTKGLNPDVETQDSRIEWLGEIPKHWDTNRIGVYFREIRRAGRSDLPVLSISIHDGITDDELSPEERDRKVSLIEDRTKYQTVHPGDLAYNMMRAWQGGFGAVAVEGLVSPAYVVATPQRQMHTRYVELLLRTSFAIEEMRRFSKGIADFRWRLYWEMFKDMRICLPSFEEQEEILTFIDKESGRIDLIIDKTQRSVDLLKEHRSALITAAVTGQIDLREDAA